MILNIIKQIIFLKRNKGSVTWDYLVFILLGLIILVVLLWMVIKSNGSFSDSNKQIGDLLS